MTTGPRELFCTSCGECVQVDEPQGAVIEPARYVCGDCQIAHTADTNPSALDGWRFDGPVPYGVICF